MPAFSYAYEYVFLYWHASLTTDPCIVYIFGAVVHLRYGAFSVKDCLNSSSKFCC